MTLHLKKKLEIAPKNLEGEKNLGEDLAPQNNNPRFKSEQHSSSASPQ